MKADRIDIDAPLVLSLVKGDKMAFEKIYRKYARELYAYARRNISSKEEAEEIIQEIFESLWLRRESLQVNTFLRAYLHGMIRYKIATYFRKNALLRKHLEQFALFEVIYDQTESEQIDMLVLDSLLDQWIERLPSRCQTALTLRLSEKLSNREIAERMNVTTRTVETYIHRSLTRFRHYYKMHLGKT